MLKKENAVFIVMTFAIVLMCAMPLFAAETGEADNLIAWDASSPSGGWKRWTPREELSPELAEDTNARALIAKGGDLEYSIGGWERTVTSIAPGDVFGISAAVRSSGIPNVGRSLWIRVWWGGVAGEVAPEMIPIREAGKGTFFFEDRFVAPEGAVSARVEIIYRWAAGGEAVWANLSLTPAGPEKPHRVPRVSTIYWRPTAPTTIENNLEHFLAMVDKAGEENPDFILLTEGMLKVGIGRDQFEALCEDLPGGRYYKPLAERARKYNTHICYGTYERVGVYVYNTAVLIGPDGELIGKYRKSVLPVGEDTDGYTPGNSTDVFDTVFGRVGMVICFETEFPEVMRAVSLKGAEMILVPIWGGSEQTVKTRARENGVFVVTAAFDMKCMIVNRRGEVLAETWKDLGDGVATADCDLDDTTKTPWTGNFPLYYKRMRNPEHYGEIVREPGDN